MKKLTSVIEELARSNEMNGFAILKPGFLDHEEEFLTLLKNNKWKVIQKKRGALTQEQAEALYKPHKNKEFYNDLVKYMCSGESLCCSCHKDCDDPIKDMSALKDKVRQKWGEDEMKNAMHSSDSIDNVARESGIVFNNSVAESLSMPMSDSQALIVSELKSLYAEEVNAFYQYWIVKEFLHGKERPSIQKKYEEYAMDELTDHGAKLLKRLNELQADCSDLFNLYITNDIAQNKYIVPSTSLDTTMSLLQNIEAEDGAINHYKKVIMLTEDVDPTTCQMLKEILADEEEHISELRDFYNDIK